MDGLGGQDSLADYRARLSQALGLDGGAPPPAAPGDQPPPDDPFATPPQGGMPEIPNQLDAAPQPQGEGPSIDGSDPDAQQDPGGGPQDQSMAMGQGGAGPSVAPSGGGTIDGSDTPTLDMAMPNPIRPTPGLAPAAPTAPTAPRAPVAKNAPRAPNAPDAPVAPTINGQPDANTDGSNTQLSSDPGAVSPAAAHKNGEQTPGGQPGIDIHPDGFNPGDPSNYKKGAIAKLQEDTDQPKPSQVFDAMKPKKQTTYMDWWEQQHGQIEDRYASMQQDLGARPDPQRDPTKKEKFQMLMDFGISLLQHGGRNGPYGTQNEVAATGDALRDSLDREQGRKQADTNRYDQQTAMIQGQKQNDLKDLGNYGNAVREDALITNANTRTAVEAQRAQIEAMKAAKPPKPGQPVTRYDSKGNQYEWDPDSENPQTGKKGVWQPSVDSTGKPLPAMQATGPRGGGVTKGPPARQAEVTDLINKGMSTSDAIDRVYGSGTKSADPTKTFNNAYSVARRNGSDPDDAKAEAEGVVTTVHGPGALDNARAKANKTTLPQNSPPISALKSGAVTTFKNGQQWTIGPDGQPKQVK